MIIESMKMEMPGEAEDRGTVTSILVYEGQAVSEGDALSNSPSGRACVDAGRGRARVTFENAAKRNALDRAILYGLADSLPGLDARCLVLTGTGTAFSAGYDIGDLSGDLPKRPRTCSPTLSRRRWPPWTRSTCR